MTILVVEDEPKTGVFLQQGLSEAGFAVERVTDGTAALQRALTTPYELLILDIMLPGLDGWQVLSQLRAAGQRIELTSKEFALLELLLRRRGEVLPKALIAAEVWDMHFDSDTNVIEVAIRRLRAKIDDDFSPKLIHTARGMGYRLDLLEPAST